MNLPKYKCHKVVGALKIARISRNWGKEAHEGYATRVLTGAVLIPTDDRYDPIMVAASYVTKHTPQSGGYYVVYEDGYESFSPAAAFEEGYTLVRERDQEAMEVAK